MEVPVSEKPKKLNTNFSIVVPVIVDGAVFGNAYYDYTTDKWWDSDESGFEVFGVTHWLEPAPLPVQHGGGYNKIQLKYSGVYLDVSALLEFISEYGGWIQHLDAVGAKWGASGEATGAAREKIKALAHVKATFVLHMGFFQ